MLNKILMPSGGQTTDEMVLLKWYKQVGEEVNQGDILFEIETDKAILTVESYAKGTLLEIIHEAGELVKTGEVIALIGKPGDLPEKLESSVIKKGPGAASEGIIFPAEVAPMPVLHTELVAEPVVPYPLTAGKSKLRASPLAKSVSRRENISLDEVAKYLSIELVKKKDIEFYMVEREKSKSDDFYFIEMTPVRKAIARHTQESVQTIPHFSISMDVDMGACMALRSKLNELLNDQGIKIAYHDILMKVVSMSLASYPLVNASYQGDKIRVSKEVNFGLAVAVEDGLLVPVVQQANRKTIAEIAVTNASNIEKARSKKIKEQDLAGGTITLSNLGMYPVSGFTAIINQPESCILAVGGIMAKTVVVNGEIVVRDIMRITASFDHRIIDGALGASFLQEVKKILEYPALLLL